MEQAFSLHELFYSSRSSGNPLAYALVTWGLPHTVLQVFGLSLLPFEGHREVQTHLKGCAGVSCVLMAFLSNLIPDLHWSVCGLSLLITWGAHLITVS